MSATQALAVRVRRESPIAPVLQLSGRPPLGRRLRFPRLRWQVNRCQTVSAGRASWHAKAAFVSSRLSGSSVVALATSQSRGLS